ncbi:SGNH/GDSL hydrolase family protein [Paenibacillus eucommiae]|uniref:SGNH hydrolase-type esterase domain-containing protein n=1 Tax=Paenibacillus eucommiae TaxID=1355755 RepID=A0ABS4IRC3_9BACL|nr:SGNH/GDSL hydrolase family protein [Paenibacillus eucommiae]MBP1990117.1 hypothetical protein [Paenibacillus eucommiae]
MSAVVVKWIDGLKVAATNPASMAVTVAPGCIEVDGKIVTTEGIASLPLPASPRLSLHDQYYTLESEGSVSPCGWDGSGRRGSNFKLYQMRVPGTLKVYSVDRKLIYTKDQDYVSDDYWGSIKVKPGGKLKTGDPVLLDYDIYTCRYHLVYVDGSGKIRLIEGDWRRMEETGLLLPDPPELPGDGLALASIFVSWGADAVYERTCTLQIESNPSDGKTAGLAAFDLQSRHLDYQPRSYAISRQKSNDLEVVIHSELCEYALADASADCGPKRDSTKRDSITQTVLENGELDVPCLRGDGKPVYWNVRLPWQQLLEDYPQLNRVTVNTTPPHIMDLRFTTGSRQESLKNITIEANNAVHPEWLPALDQKQEIQMCFIGESTTNGGDWPLLIAKHLHRLYPGKKIFTTNASDGGYSSVYGYSHTQRMQSLVTHFDFVFVEYLINDTGSESGKINEAMTGIVEYVKLHYPEAVIVIMAGNGGNPMYIPCYNPRDFERVYELHRQVARDHQAVFIGMYDHFCQLDQWGIYFLTELKENMINHPYSSSAIEGTQWDQLMASAFIQWLEGVREA